MALPGIPEHSLAQHGEYVAAVPARSAYTPVPIGEVAPLLATAERLSGLPPLPRGTVPAVWSVTEPQLQALVCKDEGAPCHGLQAVYDTDSNRILVLEWGRQRGVEWESFVVHEYVHALQYAQRGAAIYATCEATRATEQQAYDVQDAYLKMHGALLRVGSRMWWWQCPGSTLETAQQ